MHSARRFDSNVYPPPRTFEVLAFDEYNIFDTSACKRGTAVYSEAGFISLLQAEVSKRFYSSKAKTLNVHDFATAKNTVQVLVHTGRSGVASPRSEL